MTRRTHLNIMTTERTDKCPECSKAHELASYDNFLSMTRANRVERLRSLQLCFNCLLPNHRAFACRNPVRCSMCNQKHHLLLQHVNSWKVSKDNGAIVNSVHSDSPKSYLGFIAVRIIGPNGTALTHALLDSGSDTTLISEDIVKELGIVGSQTTINFTSLSGTSTMEKTAIDFDVKSLYDGCKISIEHAFTIKALSVTKMCIPE